MTPQLGGGTLGDMVAELLHASVEDGCTRLQEEKHTRVDLAHHWPQVFAYQT